MVFYGGGGTFFVVVVEGFPKTDEMNRSVTICIRDRHDNLVAHIRMKNAVLGSVDLACQKARSSALLALSAPSADFKAFPGIELSNGIISNLRGGVPLWTSAGVNAGSIGVSGGQTGEEDEMLALVAVVNINEIIENTNILVKLYINKT